MRYLLTAILAISMQGTAQGPLVSTEVELSPEAKQEIMQKAAPVIRQMFQEQKCKEADVYLGLHFDDLNLQVFVQCVEPEVENAPKKAQL